jgi:hypothetical protein
MKSLKEEDKKRQEVNEMAQDLFMFRQKERIVVINTNFDDLEKLKEEYTNPVKALETIREELK